jgi:DNA-binding NarL/FixJ family response regulator
LIERKSDKEIAAKMFVTVSAVKAHCISIFKKTESRNRTDFAFRYLLNQLHPDTHEQLRKFIQTIKNV